MPGAVGLCVAKEDVVMLNNVKHPCLYKDSLPVLIWMLRRFAPQHDDGRESSLSSRAKSRDLWVERFLRALALSRNDNKKVALSRNDKRVMLGRDDDGERKMTTGEE